MPLDVTITPVFEAGPEYAGEAAGWMFAERKEDDSVHVMAAFGQISGEGAKYANQFGPEGEDYQDSSKGFLGATAIRLYYGNNGVLHIDGVQSPLSRDARGNDGRLHVSSFVGERPGGGKGRWGLGQEEILGALKDQLSSIEAELLYRAVYYNLAIRTHEPLADPAMKEETRSVSQMTADFLRNLESMLLYDESMRSSLSIFGNIPAAEAPGAFEQTRERVGQIERAIYNSVPDFAKLWFPVVGFRGGAGRTWPYMDPTAPDPRVAYGRELDALNKRNIDPADYELRREIGELKSRLDYSRKIGAALTILSNRELASS